MLGTQLADCFLVGYCKKHNKQNYLNDVKFDLSKHQDINQDIVRILKTCVKTVAFSSRFSFFKKTRHLNDNTLYYFPAAIQCFFSYQYCYQVML